MIVEWRSRKREISGDWQIIMSHKDRNEFRMGVITYIAQWGWYTSWSTTKNANTMWSIPNWANRTPQCSCPLVFSISFQICNSYFTFWSTTYQYCRIYSCLICLNLCMLWSWVNPDYSIHSIQYQYENVYLAFIHTIMSWQLNIQSVSSPLPNRSTATSLLTM